VEGVESQDLSRLEKAHAERGSAAYPPSPLFSLLIYGYAAGVFSSRKIKRAAYDSVVFRFIAAGARPDHDTLAAFRRRFLSDLSNGFVQADGFVQVLERAQEMKFLKLGTIRLGGTKMHTNASRHSALSWSH
jgi:transposase